MDAIPTWQSFLVKIINIFGAYGSISLVLSPFETEFERLSNLLINTIAICF